MSIFLLITYQSFSQNYRNAKAYIGDFGKNELYVKESLMEYSTTIIDASPEARVQNTMERIYTKLENINTNLLKNDIGFDGDLVLRDAFIKLNNKTILLLRNKSIKLNDYSLQSGLGYHDIFKNFANKEDEIAKYYAEILAYENTKKEFGLKYKINIRNYNKKNVFEYNAYQNLIFYKLNVLDDKLIQYLKFKDIDKVNECMDFITSVGKESLLKTELYKDDFKDTSQNDTNIEFINFIMSQKDLLLPFYSEYIKASAELQKAKVNFVENNETMSVEEYNIEVKKYNKAKNDFFDNLYTIQLKKKELLDRWFFTNSDFLKRNIEFENLYDKFTNVD